jgi:glutathione peroxidase
MFDKLKDAVVSTVNRVAYGKAPEGGPGSLEGVVLENLAGGAFDKAALEGKVVLFVNVASKCGLTPQYGALAELHDKYKDRGFVVVGTPCNQFLGQEPGSAEEIATFCSATYGIDFPLLAKQDVNGAARSPLYQWLVASEAGGGSDIRWNFEKFLVGRDGKVCARFAPTVTPDSAEVAAAIEAALAP